MTPETAGTERRSVPAEEADMDFSDKNVKSIRAITLPNGRPGVHVVYTDREDGDAEKNAGEKRAGEKTPGTTSQGFRLPRIPWMKSGNEDKTQGNQASARGPKGPSRAYMKNVKRGIAVGMVITALYLLVSTL
jgi:hypothetical protein